MEIVSVTLGPVDGPPRPVTRSLGPSGRRLWLPLPPTPGLHAVAVRYRHPVGHDSPHKPDLTVPSLEGAEGGRILWTLDVPANWELTAEDAPAATGPTRQALVSLSRAAAYLSLVHHLAAGQDTVAEMGRARHRLDRLVRLAELDLQAGGDAALALGPSGQTLRGLAGADETRDKSLSSRRGRLDGR